MKPTTTTTTTTETIGTLLRDAFPQFYEWSDAQAPRNTRRRLRARDPLDADRIIFSFHGETYDFTSWAPQHPGGADAVRALAGTDATLDIMLAHAKDPHVWNIIRQFRCKVIAAADANAGPTLLRMHDDDVELVRLRAAATKRGLFAHTRLQQAAQVALPIALLFTGLALMLGGGSMLAQFVGFMLFGPLASHFAAGVVHQANHHALLDTGAANRWLTRWLMVLVGGYDARLLLSSHALHHAFTNIVGWDLSFETAPLIVWHKSQLASDNNNSRSKMQRFLLRIQGYTWTFALLFLVGFVPFVSQFATLAPFLNVFDRPVNGKRNDRFPSEFECLIIAARFCVSWALVGLLPTVLVFHVPTTLYTCYAITSHNQMPVRTAADVEKARRSGHAKSFVRRQVEATTNWGTDKGPASLDKHIEHHLFPDMPFHNCYEIASAVQKLAMECGVFYREENPFVAFGEAMSQPFDPFAQNTIKQQQDLFANKAVPAGRRSDGSINAPVQASLQHHRSPMVACAG